MTSQSQLAEFIGVRQATISRILRGSPIGKTTALKIAESLNNAIPWNEIMVIDPHELRRQLEKVITDAK